MQKCKNPDDRPILINGKYELDPCEYDVVERYRNVTVEVRQCRNCGNIDIAWIRQEDTEEMEVENE